MKKQIFFVCIIFMVYSCGKANPNQTIDEGKIILHQIIYSRLINGFDFSVNINYNNTEFKNEMLYAWLKSQLKKTIYI